MVWRSEKNRIGNSISAKDLLAYDHLLVLAILFDSQDMVSPPHEHSKLKLSDARHPILIQKIKTGDPENRVSKYTERD